MSDGDRYQLAVDGEFTETLAYATGSGSGATIASEMETALNKLPGFSGTFTVLDQGGDEYDIQYDFTDLSLTP
ncbi:hypothetical protein GUG82_16205, partial [Xanthomonas citri pv. citri]|nr:hypothetical protein [Xanthomonas citri pv. citri]